MTDDTASDDAEVVTRETVEIEHTGVPARLRELLPDQLLLLPLKARPFFPGQTMPILVDDDLWRETVERAGQTPQQLVGLVYARNDEHDVPIPEDFAVFGTVVRLHQPTRERGRIQFVAEGIERFRITRWVATQRPFMVQVEYPKVEQETSNEVRAYGLAIINKIKELLPLNPLYKENLRGYLERFGPADALTPDRFRGRVDQRQW